MTVGRVVDPASEVGQIEQALTLIVAWATRSDVHQETMRRARCDLPRGHLWVLSRLESCAPVRLSDLAVTLGVDNSTLTPQAQRLERDGLVVREADPRDGRASLLRVTRAGRTLLARLRATRRTMYAEALADWPGCDRTEAARLLSRLSQALDRHGVAPAPRIL